MIKITPEEMYEAHGLLHRLWSNAVYVEKAGKEEWKRLQQLIDIAFDELMGIEEGWLLRTEKILRTRAAWLGPQDGKPRYGDGDLVEVLESMFRIVGYQRVKVHGAPVRVGDDWYYAIEPAGREGGARMLPEWSFKGKAT